MNFYMFYGNNKGIINIEIGKLEKELSISEDDITFYDISEVDSIIEEALTISMFSSNKLIIIDSTSYLTEKKEIKDIDKLINYFDSYNSNSYLVFVSYSDTIDSKKRLVKLISSKGTLKRLEVTLDYLKDYVSRYISASSYKMSNDNINYFLSKSGNNIYNIMNELDKLMLYKIEDKVITKDDIDLLIISESNDSVYDLVNSILKNDTEKAIELYNEFKDNGMDASQMIPIIASQIRLLFQVKRLYNSGKSNEEIAKILEFKNVYRVKYLLSDSYYYSEDMLIKYLVKLSNLDREIKLGSVNGDVFLELFIAKKDM